MRSFPDGDDERAEAAKMGAESWMLEPLKLNPRYVHWGPYEDYMWRKGVDEGGKAGWDSRVIVDDWPSFKFELDDLNEVVNFYFSVDRETTECSTCAGRGAHPDAQWVTESFCQHSTPFAAGNRLFSRQFAAAFLDREHTEVHGPNSYPAEETLAKYDPAFREFCESMRSGDGFWRDKVTQDEVDALIEGGRLRGLTGSKWDPETRTHVGGKSVSASQCNEWERGPGFGHDSINRWILTGARLKRFRMPESCPTCDGDGALYSEPTPHLGLVLWVLHPRKGCSRGVHVKYIQRDQLPSVFAYLREAAKRNADRFSSIPAAVSA